VFAVLGHIARAMHNAGVSRAVVGDMQHAVFGCHSYEAALATMAQFYPVNFLRYGRPYDPCERS
jgi:hypothetical protein